MVLTFTCPSSFIPAFAGTISNKKIIHKVIHAVNKVEAPKIKDVLQAKEPIPPVPQPVVQVINYPQEGSFIGLKGPYLTIGTSYKGFIAPLELAVGYCSLSGDQRGLLAITTPLIRTDDHRAGIYTGGNIYLGAPATYGIPLGAYVYLLDNLKVFCEFDLVRDNYQDGPEMLGLNWYF